MEPTTLSPERKIQTAIVDRFVSMGDFERVLVIHGQDRETPQGTREIRVSVAPAVGHEGDDTTHVLVDFSIAIEISTQTDVDPIGLDAANLAERVRAELRSAACKTYVQGHIGSAWTVNNIGLDQTDEDAADAGETLIPVNATAYCNRN